MGRFQWDMINQPKFYFANNKHFPTWILVAFLQGFNLTHPISYPPRYMSNNRLTTIPQGTLEKLTYLKVLRLDANLLHCDCSLKWLYTFSKAKRVPVQFAAVCQTPSNLYGRTFSSLQATDFKCCKYRKGFSTFLTLFFICGSQTLCADYTEAASETVSE